MTGFLNKFDRKEKKNICLDIALILLVTVNKVLLKYKTYYWIAE